MARKGAASLVAFALALMSASSVNRSSRSGVVGLTLSGRVLLGARLVLRAAVGADAPHEPLGQDEVHGRRHVERLEAHVQQTRHRFRRRVRVQRREHHVAGERRLDGDAARFEISNLTDHDDVRVLPQERLERGGERHPDVGAHQHLVDAEEVVLDGILGGHDVDVDLVDLRQRRVERRRLAGTRRAGDEHHAVRVRDRLHEVRLGARLDAERREVERQVALVENSQHDLSRRTASAASTRGSR